MRYHELTEEDHIAALNASGGFPTDLWHRGFWLTTDGEHVDCDYENDVHHSDLVAHMMRDAKTGQDVNEAAMRNGWIRVRIIPGMQFVVEFNPKMVKSKAMRALGREIKTADATSYMVEMPGGYVKADTPVEFVSLIRRLVDKAGLRESVAALLESFR